jgi:diguanylate cyclase (GGDEF)-like protein
MDAHKVLIIDTDVENIRILSRFLNRMGLVVEEASDSKLALEKLHKSCEEFDLIFIEQRMPAFSGIDILKAIQSSNCKSCVIGMANKPDLKTVVSAMQEGAFSFITKPIERKQLRDMVHKGLESRRALIKILEIDSRLKKTNSELNRQSEKLRKEKLSLKKINQQLHLLNQLSLQINSTLDAHKMLEKVVGSKFNELIVNDLVTFFYALGDELFLTICTCATPVKVEIVEKLTRDSIREYARSSGKKVRERDIQTRVIKIKCRHKTHAEQQLLTEDNTLFIPLKVAGTVLGIMGLTGAPHPGRRQIQLISTIANQVALGLKNAAEHQKVQSLAVTDELTGIYNRRAFQKVLDRELRRSKRYQKPLSLIMLDVDGFKAINDTYGHQAGDSVLKVLAAQLQSSIRDIDFLARYGGDEFAVILPETKIEEAYILAERLKGMVQSCPMRVNGSTQSITLSMGITDISKDITVSEHELIRQADRVLYDSKERGGNAVEVSSTTRKQIQRQSEMRHRPVVRSKPHLLLKT